MAEAQSLRLTAGIDNRIGERVSVSSRILVEHGQTQQEVADKLGVHRDTVVEDEKKPQCRNSDIERTMPVTNSRGQERPTTYTKEKRLTKVCANGDRCKAPATWRDRQDGAPLWYCASHIFGAQWARYGRCSFVSEPGARCRHRRFTFVESRGAFEQEKREGWCRAHGAEPFSRMDPDDRDGLIVRLFRDVRDPLDSSGCWLWDGKTTKAMDRGSFRAEGITWYPHRAMYALFFGGHKNAHQLAHLCDRGEPEKVGGAIVRGACVNPYHLKPMTEKGHAKWTFDPDALNAHVAEASANDPVPPQLLERFDLEVGFSVWQAY